MRYFVQIFVYFQGYWIFRKIYYGDILPIYKVYLPAYFKGYGIVGSPYTSLIKVNILVLAHMK